MLLEEVAIVCIAKNEEKYINEWIYYHIKLGVSKIIIYDNSDNYSLGYLNITWAGKVWVINWSSSNIIESPFSKNRTYQGERKCFDCDGPQVWAYEDYILKWLQRNLLYKWVAFIDCDEFIKLTYYNETIVQFFKRINFHQGVLTLNWVHFGSNGNKNFKNRPLLERFNKKEIDANNHHKSICVITDVQSTNHTMHDFKTKKGWRKYTGEEHNDGQISPIKIGEIYLAHFAVKSEEEFIKKMKRKYSWSGNNLDRDWSYFNEFDKNDIEDNSLRDFLFSQKQIVNGLEVDNYLWKYRDLFENGIMNPERLFEHWINIGKKEGRITNLS